MMNNRLFLFAIVASVATSVGFAFGDHRKSMDMYQKDGNVVVMMRIPGISRDNIKISIEQVKKGQELHVCGENMQKQEVSKKDYHRQELKYGSFKRVVFLPCPVDGEKTMAVLSDGVLTITMPKTQGMKKEGKPTTVISVVKNKLF